MSSAAQKFPEPFEAELFTSVGHQAVRLLDTIHLVGNTVKVRLVDDGLLLDSSAADKPKWTRENLQAFWAQVDSHGADPISPDGRDQG